MGVAGPGSVAQVTSNPDPLLWTVTDSDVIQVYNPLSDDFVGLVGQSKPINTPFEVRKTVGAEAPTTDEASVQNAYGITLKNPDHFSPAQITTTVLLPAGETTSLLGGVAKVVVNQLVTEIMQRENNSLKMADPTARLEVERRVVRGQRSVQDLLPPVETPTAQVQNAIDKLNQGGNNGEAANPAGTSDTAQEATSSPANPEGIGPKRGPGRPKASS